MIIAALREMDEAGFVRFGQAVAAGAIDQLAELFEFFQEITFGILDILRHDFFVAIGLHFTAVDGAGNRFFKGFGCLTSDIQLIEDFTQGFAGEAAIDFLLDLIEDFDNIGTTFGGQLGATFEIADEGGEPLDARSILAKLGRGGDAIAAVTLPGLKEGDDWKNDGGEHNDDCDSTEDPGSGGDDG